VLLLLGDGKGGLGLAGANGGLYSALNTSK
jgi:hypothetical protein